MAGTSLAGIPANRDGLRPARRRGGQRRLGRRGRPRRRSSTTLGSENVAAFFCEPVIGAGGVYPPPAGYLDAVRAICRERGVLFVADEVITGYGRTGRMFASEGLEPDLVLTAKGLTSGYLPMGAVLVAGSRRRAVLAHPGIPVAARVHLLGARERRSGGDGEPRHPRERAARRAGGRPAAGADGSARPAARTRLRGRRPVGHRAAGRRDHRPGPGRGRRRRCCPASSRACASAGS